MQIAELISPSAMKAGHAFTDKITQLIHQNLYRNIIETGCYHGEGTTKAISKVLTGHEQVYSIECNPGFIEIAAKKNPMVEFLLGHSVPKEMLPVNISTDYPDHVIIDHLDHNRAAKYKQEIDFNVPDCQIEQALIYMDYKPDFVILDSAGYLGTL